VPGKEERESVARTHVLGLVAALLALSSTLAIQAG